MLVSWPAWRDRPELMGLFPSVLALSALRWPGRGKSPDSAELAGFRLQLGQTVVAALWRSVEAQATATGQGIGPTDPAWITGIARQVADAVTTQAPATTIDQRNRYTGRGPLLTAGLALAFLDQTLHAAPPQKGPFATSTGPFATYLQAAHAKSVDGLASLRVARNADSTLPLVWANELNAFVDDVNTIAAHTGIPVWTHLRDHLQTPPPGLPDPGHQSAPPHPADADTPPAGRSRRNRRARQLTTPDRRSTRPRLTPPDPHDDLMDRPTVVDLPDDPAVPDDSSSAERSPSATTVTPTAATSEELKEAKRILVAKIGQSTTQLPPKDSDRATQNLTRWSENDGIVAWPAWRNRPELKGLFPSVLALSALRWPNSKRADSAELVGFRLLVGQTVVAALWRSVEAQAVEAQAVEAPATATGQMIDPTDPGWILHIARQVADAVTTQAPTTVIDDQNNYTGHGATLTAGLALAFIDQTLHAAPPQPRPFTTSLRSAHAETLKHLTSLRAYQSANRTLPSAWTTVLNNFVNDVNTIAAPTGIPVWTHLHNHLEGPPPVLPDPRHPSAPTALSATTIDPAAATPEELNAAKRVLRQRIGPSSTKLSPKETGNARENLKKRSVNEGIVAWPAWRARPELKGLFPSVLALSSLRWPGRGRSPDSAELVAFRLQLGRTVVAALWRSVEAQAVEARATATGQGIDPTDPAWITDIARQVADAVPTQAPTTTIDQQNRYTGHGAALTGGLALAFLDQTLHAPLPQTEPFTTSLQSAHTKTFDGLTLLHSRTPADRPFPSVWANLLNAFVDHVNTIRAHTGIPVWTHLRDHLQIPSPVLPDPRHQSAPPHPADGDTSPAGPSRGNGRRRQLTAPDMHSTAARTVTPAAPAAATREELNQAKRVLRQGIGPSNTKLPPKDLQRASERLRAGSVNAGIVAWPAWRARPELKGLFPSVVALSSLRWPGRGKSPDSAELVGFRLQLGRTVVAALWRSVEAQAVEAPATATGQIIDPTDPGWIPHLARQVADAVPTQAPTTINNQNRYTGHGATLTAGLALAFLDQTLHATPPQPGPFTASLRSAHTETLKHLTSFRPSARLDQPLPSAWAKVLNDFVDEVNNIAAPTGIPVWTHLRDHLQTPPPGLPGGDPAPAAGSPRDHPDGWPPPDGAWPYPDDLWNDLDGLMDLATDPYPGETSQAGHDSASGGIGGYWYERLRVPGTGSPQEDSLSESPQAPGGF
jgi:hypothetical protein